MNNDGCAVWRRGEEDASIHVTKEHGIGIKVKGRAFVLPIERWHELAVKSLAPIDISIPPADVPIVAYLGNGRTFTGWTGNLPPMDTDPLVRQSDHLAAMQEQQKRHVEEMSKAKTAWKREFDKAVRYAHLYKDAERQVAELQEERDKLRTELDSIDWEK